MGIYPYPGLRTEWETPISCPNCYEHLSLDWSFCPECGRPIENPPLTLNELKNAEKDSQPIWAVNQDNLLFFGGRLTVPCVLDTIPVMGIGLQLVAIYGNNFSLAESDYGTTWRAYRYNPERGDT